MITSLNYPIILPEAGPHRSSQAGWGHRVSTLVLLQRSLLAQEGSNLAAGVQESSLPSPAFFPHLEPKAGRKMGAERLNEEGLGGPVLMPLSVLCGVAQVPGLFRVSAS